MRILSLNLQHGGGGRVAAIARYLIASGADAMALTEFRSNPRGASLLGELAAVGYVHTAIPSAEPGRNTVCLASRLPFTCQPHPGLPPQDGPRIVTAAFDGLTLSGVYFGQKEEKATLFSYLAEQTLADPSVPRLVIGDFNTGLHYIDEAGATFHCAPHFAGLGQASLIDAWRSRNPDAREFSWYSARGNGFRIDHVFATPTVDGAIVAVAYDQAPRIHGITDHSAIIVDLAMPLAPLVLAASGTLTPPMSKAIGRSA